MGRARTARPRLLPTAVSRAHPQFCRKQSSCTPAGLYTRVSARPCRQGAPLAERECISGVLLCSRQDCVGSSPPRTPLSLHPRGRFRDPTPALCLCVDQKGIYQVWQPLTSLLDIPAVDFVVVASTTVCASTGARLGKGTGYGEGEWGILAQLCKV